MKYYFILSIIYPIIKNIKRKELLGSLRCNEHNQAPKITSKGKTLDNLSFKISGCYDNIIQKATNKLK